MDAASLPELVMANPGLAAGVGTRMAAAVAAGGLPIFPRLDLRLRAAAALALAAVALPAAGSVDPGLPLVPLVAAEAVVGFGLGLAAAIVFAAASWAGGILGSVAGSSWADDFTPDAPAGEGGPARLATWLAVAGFLAAGGHLAIVVGLVESVQRLPVGVLAAGGGRDDLLDLAARVPQAALELAISLAAPALTAVVAFHVGTAICLRAVRFAAGPGLLQAAASLVLLAAVFAGSGVWTHGFAAAAERLIATACPTPRTGIVGAGELQR